MHIVLEIDATKVISLDFRNDEKELILLALVIGAIEKKS